MSGLYTGASGIISNMQKLQIHANNIANANTRGFKYDQETFRAFSEKAALREDENGISQIGQYDDEVYVDSIKTHFDPGNAETTGKQLDFVLHNANASKETSFFAVQRNGETYYTRNGNFTLDADRRIATYTGALVLGEDGKPIKVPQGKDFYADKEGTVRGYKDGEVFGKMQIRAVGERDLGLLRHKFGSLFQPMTQKELADHYGSVDQMISEYDGNPTLQKRFSKERLQDIRDSGQVRIFQASQADVQSGMLESSNVDMAREMTGVMTAQRFVQANQKTEQTLDGVLGKEANDVGR